MIDPDEKWDPPTREMLTDGCGIALDPGRDDRTVIVFRAICGAHGYFCSATFRDDEGYGAGSTKREAMKSLAENLRKLAIRIDKRAEDL